MELTLIILLGLALVLLFLIYLKVQTSASPVDTNVLKELFQAEQLKTQRILEDALRSNRVELNQNINQFQQTLLVQLDQINQKQQQALQQLNEKIDLRLEHILTSSFKNAKDGRDEVEQALRNFQEHFSTNVQAFNTLQRQKFDDLAKQQQQMVEATEKKLEEMRLTVDEKLHKTLEDRLGQSFKLVSDRLEAVQKGLGEMQHLAAGVGDLKKVLSNVKTRGILGEIQLGNLLEQVLAPAQYDANVKTKRQSKDHVEFAIKLPGQGNNGSVVYLPVDAKFPQESYIRLQDAYETGDKAQIETQTKLLVRSIKSFAKEIRDKYIDPPYTTDFGILFLPVEGLYAEVVRQPDLIAILQRDYKIILTGPTTLAALLNSLQMGFKTLAIQKRSSEVWDVLGNVKKEFLKFGNVLERAQNKINDANKELDTLVGTRTRVMLSKLKTVESLPAAETPLEKLPFEEN